MPTQRKLTLHTDPGHGWMSVARKDLAILGIAHKISSCSYEKANTVYLEEDCDAPIYLDAAKKAGWDVTVTESNLNYSSHIRNYDCYQA